MNGVVEFAIRQIGAGDIVTGLSLGDAAFLPLKTYLQKDARKHHEQGLARTYGVFFDEEPQRVKAYVTLVCGEISAVPEGSVLADPSVRYPYSHFPAVKIARLAVDRRLQGLGLRLGSRLVDLALGISKDVISPAVGCRVLVVDAKSQSVGFYERCGFRLLDTAANRGRDDRIMFVDLMKLN